MCEWHFNSKKSRSFPEVEKDLRVTKSLIGLQVKIWNRDYWMKIINVPSALICST